MSNALEIREAPSEIKQLLNTWSSFRAFPCSIRDKYKGLFPSCTSGLMWSHRSWVGLCHVGIKSTARNTWVAAWYQSQIKGTQPKLSPNYVDIWDICESLYVQHSTRIFSSWTEYVSHSMSSGREQLMSWHWKSLLCCVKIAPVVVDKGCSPQGKEKRCSVYVNAWKAGEQCPGTSISAWLIKGKRTVLHCVKLKSVFPWHLCFSIPSNPNCCCGVIPFLSQQLCLCPSIQQPSMNLSFFINCSHASPHPTAMSFPAKLGTEGKSATLVK